MSEHIPKYRAIAQKLRDQVASGELPPGSTLMARRNLAATFQTSRATIDRVVELLTAEGVFEPSDKNRPPVVADVTKRIATVQSRADNHAVNGRALGKNETSQILSVEHVPCPPDVAPMLGVEAGDPVLCRSRLNLVDGKPDATGSSYYPPEVVRLTPELAQPKSIPEGSRELAAKRLKTRQKHCNNVITSRLATDQERELLKLGGTITVVTQVARHVTATNGKTLEVATKVFEGNRPVSFLIDL